MDCVISHENVGAGKEEEVKRFERACCECRAAVENVSADYIKFVQLAMQLLRAREDEKVFRRGNRVPFKKIKKSIF